MRYDGPAAPPPGFPAPPPVRATRPAAYVLMPTAAVLAGIWIVAATAGLQVAGWGVAQVGLIAGLSVPAGIWPLIAVVNLAAVAAPAGLLWVLAARFTPGAAGVRAAGQAWTLAGIAGGLLGVVRTVPEPQNEILLLVSTAVAAGLAVVVSRIGLTSWPASRRPLTGFALAAGLLVLLPWLWVGALGGLSETVLAFIAAAAFGWLAAAILPPAFFRAYGRSRVFLILVGGLTAGVALVPLGAGLGGRGVNLAELMVVPALGFIAAALAAAAGMALRRTAVAVLIAAGAVGPLAFVDPEETSIVLGTADVGRWALVATLLSVAIALLAGVTSGLVLGPSRFLDRWIPIGVSLVVVAAAVAVYAVAGRPGLYGDRLFVVMADQADLTGLDTIADRPTRLESTYRRLVDHAQASQASLRASLDRWGLHYTPYYLVNAILVDGGPAVRQWLAGRSDVDRVLLDQRLRPLPTATPVERGDPGLNPGGAPQWNITKIQAPRVWSEFDDQGQGIVIGTSDSGVDGGHPDLVDGYRGGDDSWFDPWNGTRTPSAHNGHGTHTIGTALGRNGIGVAPRAQWIGCVNLDRNLGSPSHYLDCLQFMLAPFPLGADPWRDGRPQRAPDILTNSWGCPAIEGCDADALRNATAALRAAGIYFVAAAGNTGPYCSSVDDPPAPYPDVLTVGALGRSGEVAPFSSRGPTDRAFPGGDRHKPDLVAPGVGILSALPQGGYGVLDGTSMAAPHVAGVVALMWSANPELIGHIDTTTKILRDTATPVAIQPSVDSCGSPLNVAGAGQVDAYAAVLAARAIG